MATKAKEKQPPVGLGNGALATIESSLQTSGDTLRMLNVIVDNMAAIETLSKVLVKSGWLPQHLDNEGKVTIVVLKALECNIPFMEAVTHLFPVNGKVAMTGKLMNSLITRSGGAIEVLQKDEEVCKVKFMRDGREHIETYTLAQAQKAGLFPKTKEEYDWYVQYWDDYKARKENTYNKAAHSRYNPSWLTYTQDHLFWKCMKRGCDVMFSDVVSGMALLEDVEDPQAVDAWMAADGSFVVSDMPKPKAVPKSELGKKYKVGQATYFNGRQYTLNSEGQWVEDDVPTSYGEDVEDVDLDDPEITPDDDADPFADDPPVHDDDEKPDFDF